MNDTIILLVLIGVSALVGTFVGFTISKLKSQGEYNRIEDRYSQLLQWFSKYKKEKVAKNLKQEFRNLKNGCNF